MCCPVSGAQSGCCLPCLLFIWCDCCFCPCSNIVSSPSNVWLGVGVDIVRHDRYCNSILQCQPYNRKWMRFTGRSSAPSSSSKEICIVSCLCFADAGTSYYIYSYCIFDTKWTQNWHRINTDLTQKFGKMCECVLSIVTNPWSCSSQKAGDAPWIFHGWLSSSWSRLLCQRIV